ncbi:hypothetical protein OOZ15_19485 [Galbibacter sp. EGI 63066]|uniref:hypothetical protein n=1 Tax=Galbibacter sp. EGI 63066 TaxID=2993559 RepID=UPI00224986E0|nr:hypothetical protein [Galbibacter sp. EGI 63066]MCX2682138.1 hypothetical protein [Galbibacter sp. EGI 63066]
MELRNKIYYLLALVIFIGCKPDMGESLIDKVDLGEWKTSMMQTINNNCEVNHQRFIDTINHPPFFVEGKRIKSFDELVDLYISKRKPFLEELIRHEEKLNIKNGQISILEMYTPKNSRYVIHSDEDMMLEIKGKDEKYQARLLNEDEKTDHYLGEGFDAICTNHSPLLGLNLLEIYSIITVKGDSVNYNIRNIVMSD